MNERVCVSTAGEHGKSAFHHCANCGSEEVCDWSEWTVFYKKLYCPDCMAQINKTQEIIDNIDRVSAQKNSGRILDSMFPKSWARK